MKMIKLFIILASISISFYFIFLFNNKKDGDTIKKNNYPRQQEHLSKSLNKIIRLSKNNSYIMKALKYKVLSKNELNKNKENKNKENKNKENRLYKFEEVNDYKILVNSDLQKNLKIILEEQNENLVNTSEKKEVFKKVILKERQAEKNLNKKNELLSKGKDDLKDESTSIEKKFEEIKFKINTIELKSLYVLKKDANKIKATYENRELGLADINHLISELSNLYLKNGYISTRVMMTVPQNLSSGKLQLEIINGTIEKFSYGNNRIREKTAIATAFPFLRGDILNLKDIESGIKVVNSVPSNNVKMKILPGSNLGNSIIELTNEKEKRYRLGLIYDNAGQENTGINRGKLTLGLDNLLGINDVFNFTYTNSLSDNTKNNYSKSYAGNYKFPLGKYTFTTSQQYSNYLIPIKGINNDYTSKGNTYEQIYSIDREINLFDSLNENLKIKLNLKDRKNYMQDLLLNKSSYKTSDMSLEYLISKEIQDGSVSLNLGYTRNVKVGTYANDEKEFEKMNINFDLSKVYKRNKDALIYTLNAQSQLSKKDLYGISEMSIGDNETLRGYKDNGVSGDNGILLTNNLTYRPVTQNKYMQGFQFFTGLDYGRVYNYEDKKNQDLFGLATGIKWNYKYLGVNLTWARALTKNDEIKENKGEIYTEVSLSY